MFNNYLKIALRNLSRNKVFSFINIVGLAIGITCFITLGLFVLDELNYDEYNKNANQIYRVIVHSNINGLESTNAKSSAPLGATLVKDFPEVIASARIGYFGQYNIRYKDKTFSERDIYTADSNYFNIFTLPFLYGDSKTALVRPNSIVISETAAKKYFGNENPLGKTFTVNDTATFLITGVMKDYPKKSHFRCNFLLSMSTYSISEWNNWLDAWYTTYVVLKKGSDAQECEKKMQQTVKNYVGPLVTSILGASFDDLLSKGSYYRYRLQPLTSIYLYSRGDYGVDVNTEWGNARSSDIAYIYIYLSIGFFMLLIAVINFMNLATARSEKRAKEVGIRKTLGSDKSKLIWQFMTESIFTCFLSIFLSIGLLQFTVPFLNNFTSRDLKLEFFNNLYTIPLLIILTIVIGILAGSYPAFYLSSFQPSHVMKSNTAKGGQKSLLRSLLVIIQFTISIMLIIGTLIIKDQLNYIQDKNLGFNKEHLITIDNTSIFKDHIESFKQEISNIQNVVSSTASTLMFQSGIPGEAFLYDKVKGNDIVACQYLDVDYDFEKTYQIKIKEGRFFSKDFSTDTNAVLINETAAKEFKACKPLGKILSAVEVSGRRNTYKIIGVVKDFNYESLHQTVRPLVFHLSSVKQAGVYFTIRVKSNDVKNTLASIEKVWHEFAGNKYFKCTFIDENLARMYEADKKIGTITTAFSFIAIFIACLGLFGLAAFVTEQRIKEIGIRKVLGASIMEIVLLLSKEFTKWVVIANLIAWPVAFYVMNNWLHDFAYRIEIGWTVFILSGIIALVIAIVTVSLQTVKAALANPIESLKYE
jgi:putative ABC transport system permease protein